VRTIAAVLLTTMLAAAAGRAAAQVVRGDVQDAATHEPLYGAIVVAYDSAGARVGGTFTDDSGRFALRLPAGGSYQLRAERIGYASGAAVPFVIAPGATVVRHLVASSAVVLLPTDTVIGESRCVVRATEGAQTAALWEEARKALYASQIADQDRLVFAVRRRWWTRVDATGAVMRVDSTRIDSVTLAQPFASPATPEELAANGYGIGGAQHDSVYAGPDADVLLSDAFARTHCFAMRLDSDKHPGLVGLAFEPSRKVHFAEVTGVIWLDSATARLRFVEFRHTNLFPEVSPRHYGGRIDFEELPGGAWIIRRWYIRLPVVANGPTGGGGRVGLNFMGSPHAVFFHEEGGEVLSARLQKAPQP
jgi:hypothetical protein